MRRLMAVAIIAGSVGALWWGPGPLAKAAPRQEAAFEIHMEPVEAVFRPGDTMRVRVAIFNSRDAAVDVPVPDNWLDGLRIVGPDGKTVREEKSDAPSKTTRTLQPGEFFGRIFEIGKGLDVPEDGEGIYRLTWVSGKNTSATIPVCVMRDYLARVSTNYGDFAFQLLPQAAPFTVDHFVHLVRRGIYKDVTVHRVIADFMMQAGRTTQRVPQVRGEFGPGYQLHHLEGSVAMARGDERDSATSEFYVCFKRIPELDHLFTIFGQVIEGMDVVHKIEHVRTDHNECPACGGGECTLKDCRTNNKHHKDEPLPTNPVTIKSITLELRK